MKRSETIFEPLKEVRIPIFLMYWFLNVFRTIMMCIFQDLNFWKWSEFLVFLTFWFGNEFRAIAAYTFLIFEFLKVIRYWGNLYILIWKCSLYYNTVYFLDILTSCVLYIFILKYILYYNGVYFLDILISKNNLLMMRFIYFNFEICFAL